MDRNCDILKHILKYCEDVLESIDLFGDDIEIFKANSHYRNDISMCLLQIGELTKHLTDDFKQQYKDQIPWTQIRGMRNLFAHAYLSMNTAEIFKTAHENIPPSTAFCKEKLRIAELVNQEAVEPEIDDDDDEEWQP